ncbi:MAG: rod shape-determining protein RodA [Nitriliruptoraceae bacterium]
MLSPLRRIDGVLLAAVLALTGIGFVAIYSSNLVALTTQDISPTVFVNRQLLALMMALIVLTVAVTFDYRDIRTATPVLYVAAVLLLIVTLTPLGTEIRGSQRWILLFGVQLQAAEFAKIGVLLALAAVFHEAKGQPRLAHVAGAIAVTVVPTMLVFLQPDLGTSIVFLWVLAVACVVAGVRLRGLIAMGVAALAGVIAAVQFGLIQSYQIGRLTAFLNADDPTIAQSAAFQTRQSLIAIGSGQFAGRGLFQGTQTSLSYVPDNHTDFIFTVIGEEFGFVGSTIVLGLFFVVVWRGLRIAINAKDVFGSVVATGIVAMLTLQMFVNIGMTVGIMPVTGLPLPFLSYGGTSLIAWFAMVGLLLNIHMRRF